MASSLDLIGHASELVQQGRLPEARAALDRVLAGAPDHAEALHLAGLVEMMSGDPAAAVTLLRRCVEIAPAVPFAWSNLGVAYNAGLDFTNALACFRTSLELAPGNAAALKNQGIALRRLGRHDEAVGELGAILDVNPGFAAQRFIPASVDKVRRARQLLQATHSRAALQVDGGIARETIATVWRAGADTFVAGNAIFSASDPRGEIGALRSRCMETA